VNGKAEITTQALGHLLRFGGRPAAFLTTEKSDGVFEVRSHDHLFGAALGTNEAAIALKVANRANVGAGKVMDQAIVGQVDTTAAQAAATEARQALAARADLHAVPEDRRQHAYAGPGFE
jgi:hypothetical protein